MIRINLLPVRQLKKRAKARNQIVAVTIGFIFFLAALGAVAYLQTMKVSALQTSIADTNREIEKFKPVLAQIKKIEATQKELERKSAVIDKLKSDSSLTVRVLDEVANIIDNERMWLLDLNQQGGSLSLNGVALDNQTVAEFMDDLKLSPFVSNVELTDSSLRKVAGRDLKSFSLSCSVSQPAPPSRVTTNSLQIDRNIKIKRFNPTTDGMKKNDAFTNFLDTKYIPLERKIKLLLLVLIFVIPAVAYYFFFLDPNMKEISQLTGQKTSLEQELQKVKSRARDLPKLQAELARLQIEFDKKSALLPREKEIPNLLRDISALGTNSGLDFLKFKPLPTVPRDFYNDVPVSINVRGPYHSVGSFFDRVSKLERIVSVTNIRMSSPKLEGGEMLLNSDCQLVTYQFTDKELPKEPKKK